MSARRFRGKSVTRFASRAAGAGPSSSGARPRAAAHVGPRQEFDETSYNSIWQKDLHDVLSAVAAAGIQLDTRAEARLLQYCADIGRASRQQGLVSRSDLEHLASKHIAASLGVLSLIRPAPGEAWLDAGTGAGFPGMVLQLCFPQCDMTLIDSSARKTGFLREERDRLEMDGPEVICSRLEEPFVSERRGPAPTYDVLLSRAMAPLGECLKWTATVAHPASRLVVFKGPGWEEDLSRARLDRKRSGWSFLECKQIPWSSPKLLLFARG